jgi:tetratricopeptide (TPR) repeat protein
MRVVGGKNQTRVLEGHAIEHLCRDQFEEAVELYDDIYHAYKETFKQRNWTGGNGIVGNGELDTKQYLGNALHSMGVCHFLNHDYKEALSAFEKAAENRKSLEGTPTSEELTTRVKIALCHHALDDFSKSHKQLELCLESAKGYCKTITDFIQIAEILNNLGCLSFMGGEHDTAMKMFSESLDVQEAILSHSLYGGSVLAGHSTNLNISITRANVAFLKLCAEDHLAAILSFEAALSTQQMLLYDAHETLIGTMDHLAAANLLGGNKEKALNMLERMLRAQASAYGADDPRCENTKNKIGMVTSNTPKVKISDDNISAAKSKASSKASSKAASSSKGSSKSDSKTSSSDGSNSNFESGKEKKATQKQKTPKLLRKLSTTFLKTQGMMMRQPSNGGANLLSL